MSTATEPKEFTDDREMQLQSLHLRPHLQVRPKTQGLQLRPVVQVRRKLRLRELTELQRSV